ncbi:uncharacterized protein LOC110987010 [Acanthaster planci]|uniref:Uncharacterized protein LOC110987010 n=1 Tax=Acanthaster planci TaxID=133434 RepID=A0A8B7ZHM0_ACAPL|nr:uncharacterized protein LOC110987010 [Acanthaster planci]
MAASSLEQDGDGLKLDPNFELLAILLALAFQEEDAERFLEVYDNVIPKSLSVSEVEGIKDRARDLADLPGETLLELKAAQESEAALFSSPAVGSLGHFVSRHITDSLHPKTAETGYSNHLPHGKFQSKSGALLSQRLNAHTLASSSPNIQGDILQWQGPVSHLRNIGLPWRADAESQAGISYLRQPRRLLQDTEKYLDQETFPGATLTLDSTFRDTNSNLDPNRWSTMEPVVAPNKVQQARTTGVKQHKKLSPQKHPATSSIEQQYLTNGTTENAKSRTPKFTDKEKQCIKSKPPQTASEVDLCKSEPIAKIPNCSLLHLENSLCDNSCELGDCTKEERAALIPKSPPIPDFPPFKSLEDVGHSVGKLLTNSQPKHTTCPPPWFLSTTTATLAYPDSSDGVMAAKVGTKYGTVPDLHVDVCMNSAVSNDGPHQKTKTTLNLDTLSNHQLPDDTPEGSTHVDTNSFSTPEVPSHVNKLAADVSPSTDGACDQVDNDEFDINLEEQPKSIECQWNAAKKKKKKNKKKKAAGTGFESASLSSVKLPVGAPPLPHSPPELRNKLQLKDSHSVTTSKVTAGPSSENARHPPPMVSSDSVTSSGESSADGGACTSDVSSQQHNMDAVKRDAGDCSDNVPQTPQIDSATGGLGAGKTDSNSTKDVCVQGDPLVKPEPANNTPEADIHFKADIQPYDQFLSKLPAVQPGAGLTVKSDPSDSDSDKNDAKVQLDKEAAPDWSAIAGKPHSLSEPTGDSADNEDTRDFIKVEYKRSLRIAKKRSVGVIDDHRFVHSSGRYMERDRDYSRSRNLQSAGLRKSSSEPAGMFELGDKDSEGVENKAKPKYLSDSVTKTDMHLTSSVLTETTTVQRSEFSYASKVKSNMKTSSLPPKLSPQALLDYGDDDQSDNPASSENSSDSVTGNKPAVLEPKPMPSGISVLDKSDTSCTSKSEFVVAHSAKEQLVKNSVRPEKHYIVSQTMRPPGDSSKVGQVRSFQRSSSVDTSGVTKKVSFDDNSIRRTVPPQGPEASVQYLDLTYAGRLKGQRPAVSKAAAVHPQLLTSDVQRVQVAGLKDLKSQPKGSEPNEKEVLITSKATIVLGTKTPTQNDLGRGSNVMIKPGSSNLVSSTDFKPVDQPASSQPRASPATLPLTSRNTTSSPTPSVGSSTSKPHPVFDLDPQDNFDITFGSVIVRKAGYEILREESSAMKRGSPVKEILSNVPATGQLPTPTGLSCAELEKSFMSQDSNQPTPAKVDDAAGGDSSATSGVSFGKFDGALGIKAALEGKKDDTGDFNHLEVAGMLFAEWCKTQTEIGENKVLVLD